MSYHIHTAMIFSRLRKVLYTVASKPYFIFIIVLVSAFMWYLFGLDSGFLWFIFLLFLLYRLDSRLVGVFGIAGISLCPLILYMHKDKVAEQVAVFFFYFLVIMVMLQFIEDFRGNKKFVNENN